MFRPLLAAATLALTAPALAEEVNIYSYRQPGLLSPLTDAFTDETGIEVNVVHLNRGLVERLVAEGRRSPADLVMTVDISRLDALVASDVVQPVASETLQENIPAEFRHPDGLWFGLSARARIVYAARDRVEEGAVTSYEALADPEWKRRICTRSGTHDYTIGLVAAHIVHHGEAATETWLTALKNNLARKPQGNDRAQVKAIWAGECDIALGNTYYMAQMLNDPDQRPWADAVRIVFPVFDGGGVHLNISGVAMTKSAPNREAALKLMEFLSSDTAQAIYADVNYEYPLKPGVPINPLVASWGSFTPDTIGLSAIAQARGAALKLVERVDFDG